LFGTESISIDMQRPAPTSAYAVVTMYGLMISIQRRPVLLVISARTAASCPP
jgi:hypothetical protein